ncbi:hypothetical protein [Ralstonia pseudosolanacearum]|uniref:hypothetical protein n=1 Tax=Ralstonia pseudosolanacearum TaxID=1310165 RepID=UPI003CF31E21
MLKKNMAVIACAFAAAAAAAHAQPQATAPDSAVTVVTLYSETRPAIGVMGREDKPARPPITIANGGVKSAGDTCWKLSDTGELTPVAGDCYVLRSAEPGERPPAQ